MRQALRPGALGKPRGSGWRGRWEGGSGWGTHVNPWLIHVNVWQKPLQYCKVISLQLIKINGGKKNKAAADHVVFNESWGRDKSGAEDVELVSPHKCIKNTSPNASVLTEHCWTLAEDIRHLGGQEGPLPDWVGWDTEGTGRGEAAGWDVCLWVRVEGKAMFPRLGKYPHRQEGQRRQKGCIRGDRTRAQQPVHAGGPREAGADNLRAAFRVWASRGCVPHADWGWGLGHGFGEQTWAQGRCWQRGDRLRGAVRRPRPSQKGGTRCDVQGAQPCRTSLPRSWTYLQTRNWVTDAEDKRAAWRGKGERPNLGGRGRRIYTAMYKT